MKVWFSENYKAIEKKVSLINESSSNKILIKIKFFGLIRANLGQIEEYYLPPKYYFYFRNGVLWSG